MRLQGRRKQRMGPTQHTSLGALLLMQFNPLSRSKTLSFHGWRSTLFTGVCAVSGHAL